MKKGLSRISVIHPMCRLVASLALPFLLFLGSTGLSHAVPAYLWVTPEGESRVSDTIPSDQRHLGYRVIDTNTGQIIRKVDPVPQDEPELEQAGPEQAIEVVSTDLDGPIESLDSPSSEDQPGFEIDDQYLSNLDRYDPTIDSPSSGDQLGLEAIEQQVAETRKAIRDVLEGKTEESLSELQKKMADLYRQKVEGGWL